MQKLSKATILAVIITLLAVGTTYAITIVIDGSQDTVWTTGSGGQMPGAISDINEGGITDDADLKTFRYTNDQTYFYMLIESYGTPTRWSTTLATRVDICFDTDGNPGTGFSYTNCDGSGTPMDGIERVIRITPIGGTNLQWFVYDDAAFSNIVGTGSTFTGDVAFSSSTITELRVPLSSLGIDTQATCNGTMLLGIYFDGGTVDPDDNLPDTGQSQVTCGNPTAIALQSVGVSGREWIIPYVIGALLLLLVGTGLFYNRKRSMVE